MCVIPHWTTLLTLANEALTLIYPLQAETYEQHRAAAAGLDKLDDYSTAWKASIEPDSTYDPQQIIEYTQDFDMARVGGDLENMLALMRTELRRNLGGIGNPDLYNHSHIGTKRIIERHVRSSVALVEEIVAQASKPLPPGVTHRDILTQLEEAKKSYGTTALVLSGGSVFGMAHIGVLKALFEQGLLPKIISGTSAGSIVAAVICTRKDEEIPRILEQFAHGDLAVFTDRDNPETWYTHLLRTLSYGTWHDSKHISRVMQDTIGDYTFREAFNRTGRVLNITVSSKRGLELPSLLNHQTAPNVLIWSAVVTSCSVPGVFESTTLFAKDETTGARFAWDPAGQLWIDGSIDNDVPLAHLGHLFGVNNAIVSQTNPHVAPFLSSEKTRLDKKWPKATSGAAIGAATDLFYDLAALAKLEAIYCSELLVQARIFPDQFGMLAGMMSQPYTADINILPRMSPWWALSLISNPTPTFMMEACRVGERDTWPNICRIKDSMAVEQALDFAIASLAEMKAFSESQVNLRRLYTGYPDLGVPPDQVKLKTRHARRGSGGSLQLSMRRRLNRELMENMDDEYSSDLEAGSPTGSSRRAGRSADSGKPADSTPSLLDVHGHLPSYNGMIKTNSLVHLPPMTPSPPVRAASVLWNGLTPFTNITDGGDAMEAQVAVLKAASGDELEVEADEDEDLEEMPVLVMKSTRGSSHSVSSSERKPMGRAGEIINEFENVESSSDPQPYEQVRLFSTEGTEAEKSDHLENCSASGESTDGS